MVLHFKLSGHYFNWAAHRIESINFSRLNIMSEEGKLIAPRLETFKCATVLSLHALLKITKQYTPSLTVKIDNWRDRCVSRTKHKQNIVKCAVGQVV